MNEFVAEARRNGAAEYSPEEDGEDEDEYGYIGDTAKTGFNITPYERPKAPTNLSYANSIQTNDDSNMNQQQQIDGPMGGAPTSNPMNTLPSTGEPQLTLRGSANVWGKGGLSNPSPAAPTPAPVQAPTPAPPPPAWGTTPTSSVYSSYNKTQPAEPPKSRELTERERMAAALFGGIAPGSEATPPAPSPAAVPTPSPPVSHPVPAATPVAPPVPVPAPAPEIDLLDLGFSSPAPAAPTQQAPTTDPFSNFLSTTSSPTPTPKPPSFQNQPLTPLQITTAQFGQTWGSCPHTSTKHITKSYPSPDVFLQSCIGFHIVEVIPATNEGIAAGSIGDCAVLLHLKIGNSGVDVIIKSMDGEIGLFLSGWLVDICNA